MKQILSVMLSTLVVLALSNAANAADEKTVVAEYDPLTGEIFVDVGTSVAVVGFNAPGLFNTSTPALGIGTAGAVQFSADDLAYFDANGLPSGAYGLGRVLPTGLDATTAINFAYTPVGSPTVVATVANRGGVIPEPAALLMGLVACVSGLRRRR